MSKKICSREDCQRPHQARGLCHTHYEYDRTHGPLEPLSKPNSYEGMHHKVRREKGKATEHDCVDCGGPAHHWSLSAGAEEIIAQAAQNKDHRKKFSRNLDDYEARCRKCHSKYDLANELLRGPMGNRSRIGRTESN